ncbi:uncharacterized protein EI90DRAFT_3012818 [Cantharellus anzutake]|uniref:uncharacterized protein n=1 Tax=Cantharellus anzutake TaxID=1750568 RepID=UPI001908755B|nr:uncharacterized protein EI90DRAFT_3012818 [Cantharellus anzutake]KAF8339909.1 hypothetical protein EI90DRAFT_3012818 [Cantharellus anzutake]
MSSEHAYPGFGAADDASAPSTTGPLPSSSTTDTTAVQEAAADQQKSGPGNERVYLACQQCRVRKVRCDGFKPRCSTCIRRKSPKCEYDAVPKRRGPDRIPRARPGQIRFLLLGTQPENVQKVSSRSTRTKGADLSKGLPKPEKVLGDASGIELRNGGAAMSEIKASTPASGSASVSQVVPEMNNSLGALNWPPDEHSLMSGTNIPLTTTTRFGLGPMLTHNDHLARGSSFVGPDNTAATLQWRACTASQVNPSPLRGHQSPMNQLDCELLQPISSVSYSDNASDNLLSSDRPSPAYLLSTQQAGGLSNYVSNPSASASRMTILTSELNSQLSKADDQAALVNVLLLAPPVASASVMDQSGLSVRKLTDFANASAQDWSGAVFGPSSSHMHLPSDVPNLAFQHGHVPSSSTYSLVATRPNTQSVTEHIIGAIEKAGSYDPVTLGDGEVTGIPLRRERDSGGWN